MSLKSIRKPSSIAKISQNIKDHMSRGNVNAAMNLLTNNMENGVFPLNVQALSQIEITGRNNHCQK